MALNEKGRHSRTPPLSHLLIHCFFQVSTVHWLRWCGRDAGLGECDKAGAANVGNAARAVIGSRPSGQDTAVPAKTNG